MNQFCLYCQTQLIANTSCNSFVYENGDGHWIRCDACDLCWEKISKKPTPNENIPPERFFWRSKVNSKLKKDISHTEEIEKAVNLLRSILSNVTEETQAEAFILALFLKRKKKLVERKEIKHSNGEIFALYEDIFSREPFLVPKINIDTLRVGHIQESLKGRLLNKSY